MPSLGAVVRNSQLITPIPLYIIKPRMAGSALFAFPVGVMSGIYMNEYAPKGKLVRFIRMMTNTIT